MNARCPKCETVFRVDPAKVPARGVRARCSVCGGVFFVGHAAEPAPEEARAAVPAIPAPAPAPAPGAAPRSPLATPVAAVPPTARPAPSPTHAATPIAQPAPAPAPPATRAVNPFLAQDPATKARRLARALISDLVVYHPARRADGLRDGTLKLLFEEEIRKCWEEYTEQVGREMATSTPFFTEALNEILADGQAVFS